MRSNSTAVIPQNEAQREKEAAKAVWSAMGKPHDPTNFRQVEINTLIESVDFPNALASTGDRDHIQMVLILLKYRLSCSNIRLEVANNNRWNIFFVKCFGTYADIIKRSLQNFMYLLDFTEYPDKMRTISDVAALIETCEYWKAVSDRCDKAYLEHAAKRYLPQGQQASNFLLYMQPASHSLKVNALFVEAMDVVDEPSSRTRPIR